MSLKSFKNLKINEFFFKPSKKYPNTIHEYNP